MNHNADSMCVSAACVVVKKRREEEDSAKTFTYTHTETPFH